VFIIVFILLLLHVSFAQSCTLYREGSFFVCTKSTSVYLMNDMGQVLKRFSVALGETCSDFVHLAGTA
jgi:hypothetical protein